ncbi:hypothetical protein BU23DRAFT_570746 [Bimuria novae-zelandiae CBS 107.79]|uniref:MFS general substrate transporter n=1 Tax=Bimuria novae-zelandiae CBS 107.79 TaxID=1447943 RepID=A0A6A5V261_9PLEO|nr:hypothetical protein BU23DRAFT_570746 [Bimuria novae-zelandiae CBS 107.79]
MSTHGADVSKGHAEIDDSDVSQESPVPSTTRTTFFRTTLFQILVVGTCAFCAPGIWSAMNGLGVGGSQSPDLVNAANALLYAFMTVTCFLGPWLTNLIGFKYTLAIGSRLAISQLV